ncbi:efflux RND transporter periplasmic adaptor subunit [Methylophaga sp.]|uniref:efflux RND transporter periplasmic adaptor subunit n=1 Tax=Methylophaga sp. TaxID=2024840 RepID=UPI003F6961F1
MKTFILCAYSIVCLISMQSAYAADKHDDTYNHEPTEQRHDSHNSDAMQAAHEHDDQESVELSAEQMRHAGITVVALRPELPESNLLVAGEVKQNGYTSYHVSPRVDSVVLKRHVALGEHVEVGQKLVTLFSDKVAEAQANYVDRYADWQRIKSIGPGSISDKRIKESQTAYHASVGRLRAYGLSRQTIQSLSIESRNLGEYSLSAETNGTVLADDFNQGQQVQAGEEIIQVADESQLWVEARLSPDNQLELASGTPATIFFGDQQFSASVAQEAHTIDPLTRTRVVRLLVNNSSHQLHPGMFVNVLLKTDTHAQLLVPESALIRNDQGHWQIFVLQEPGHFVAQDIERRAQHDDKVAIAGIKTGTKVAVSGAFFIASQIAKGGFDPHNH